MTAKEIKEFRSLIDQHINNRRLGDAFNVLRNAAKVISSWKVNDRIEKAEQGYNYLLRYMIDGVEDPSRDEVYNRLLSEAATLRDILTREMSLVDTPTLYYNTLRSVNSHRDETLTSLYESFRSAVDFMSPFANAVNGATATDADRLRVEMIERDIFNRLWITFPLNIDDYHLTAEFLADDSIPYRTRALAVSALTLSLLEFFDEKKLRLLLEAYRIPETHIAVRALTGAVIVLDKYKTVGLSYDIINTLASLKELPGWHEDLRQVFVELIRTNDTRRISAKLNEEIFPGIKKMGRDMADKLKDTIQDGDTVSVDDINPEWEGMISDPKILENLKELGELQQEGADVFMATFSSLKQFPFFNEAANWFMPYDPEHSAVASSSGKSSKMASLISSGPFVCDSDKYSMALSMSMMPDSQRDMITSQLDAHSNEIDDMLASTDGSLHPVDKKSEINNYVHSLYRFYMLFRRKGDFYSPFGHVTNPIDLMVFASDFDSEESLLSLGEFYFKIGLYDYARRIFSRLDEIAVPDASRYQKLGFCCEKLGDLEQAASYYEQSDLLNGDNLWNLKRLNSVYRRLGQISSAISVAKRLTLLQPDSINAAVNLGYLHIMNDDYNAAIEELRRAEFLSPDSTRPLRPLAWALFLNGQADVAGQYYDRIITDDPTPSDLLNAGHAAWSRHRLGEAINYYRLSAENSSADTLVNAIRNDAEHLVRAGIDASEIPLMIDATLYSLKK